MRKIYLCAWMILALPGCSGGEFSTPSSTPPSPSAGASGGGSTQPEAGATAQDAPTAEPPASGGQAGSTSSSSGSSSANAGGGSSDALSDCPEGAITFRMLPSPELAPDYLCDAGCSTGWLTITDKDHATSLPISSSCGTASCEACEVRQCATAACLATPLSATGSELVWDGTYLAKDTCGPSKLACQRRSCASPGKYNAKACAAVSAGPSLTGGCMPREQRICKEVEFEFPATKTVELVLGN
jgi:hypothetical protein